MHGVFEGRQAEPARPTGDTEVTLSVGGLLAIVAGLILLCGLFFWMGYAAGHHRISVASSGATPQTASDQEPLQPAGAIPKPSAVMPSPVAQTADQPSAAGQPDATAESGATAAGDTAQSDVYGAVPAGGAAQGSANGAPQSARPAFSPQSSQFMVQIAAISNTEDAEVLVNALKKRNYPVTAKREPADNFIHVRLGPFPTHAAAEQWRMKLINDGYNALIQP